MRKSTPAVVVVFAVALAATAGLGLLLYKAGESTTDEAAGGGAETGRKRDRRRAESAPDSEPPAPRHLPAESRPKIPFAEHTDLELHDWKEIGASYVDFMQVVRDFADNPEAPTRADAERMQRMKAVMIRFTDSIMNQGPDRPMPPGSLQIDHPAFGVNLMASALETLKLPLSEDQSRKLEALARERAPAVVAADPSKLPEDKSVYRLDLLVARAEALEAFGTDALKILTREQGAALVPEHHRGRLRLDMFCGGSVLINSIILMRDVTPETLTATIVNGLSQQFNVTERQEEVRAIVEAWVREGDYRPADSMDARGILHFLRVVKDARRMSTLLHRLVEGLKLPETSTTSARETTGVYVPLMK